MSNVLHREMLVKKKDALVSETLLQMLKGGHIPCGLCPSERHEESVFPDKILKGLCCKC